MRLTSFCGSSLCSLTAAWCLAAPYQAHAEIHPDWPPSELAPRCDLIVLGTEQPGGTIRITRILKGAWAGKEIKVPGLATFTSKPSIWSGGEKGQPEFTDQLVAF